VSVYHRVQFLAGGNASLHVGVDIVDEARVPASPALTCSGVVSATPRPGTSARGCNAAMLSSVCGQSLK